MSEAKRRISSGLSIRTKLMLSIGGLLTLTLLSCWLANRLFLPFYYQYSKVATLSDSFERINRIVSRDKTFQENIDNRSLSKKSQTEMDVLAANGTMSAYVFQISNFLGILQYSFYYPTADSIGEGKRLDVREKTLDYVVEAAGGSVRGDDRELIQNSSHYQVNKVYNERIGSYYLELFGQTDTGEYVYLSTNYQSIQESVKLSNRFLMYIGLAAVAVVVLLGFVIGESFVRPISDMTDIATRMSKLDFEVKYPVTTDDEIGRLGNSINTLSEQLEETISELKSANNELQRNIEHKIQIDEMRKDFLSNVSHELKTPIALIQGYAEGLQENINDDSESREFYCEVIIDEADKMNEMVKKLLALNQIEFGNSQMNFERFDLTELLRSVISSVSLLAENKEASIFLEENKPVYVWSDEYMVEEILTNYLSNAINHVDGEKQIRVSMEHREKTVRVSVFNTGQLIPEDELDKIWIKFYKVDKARTRAYGGNGIGLSIVKAVADALNQECGVKNHSNGVEFWVDIGL